MGSPARHHSPKPTCINLGIDRQRHYSVVHYCIRYLINYRTMEAQENLNIGGSAGGSTTGYLHHSGRVPLDTYGIQYLLRKLVLWNYY